MVYGQGYLAIMVTLWWGLGEDQVYLTIKFVTYDEGSVKTVDTLEYVDPGEADPGGNATADPGRDPGHIGVDPGAADPGRRPWTYVQCLTITKNKNTPFTKDSLAQQYYRHIKQSQFFTSINLLWTLILPDAARWVYQYNEGSVTMMVRLRSELHAGNLRFG